MATIDQQFVEYIVKTLVNNPDKVTVDRTIDEKGVLLNLNVDEEDVGRIIGRRGATAQSLRTLLRALGTKNDAHYNLKINNSERAASDEAEESSAVEAEEPEESEEENDESQPSSELAEKTRAELADLDDLDI